MEKIVRMHLTRRVACAVLLYDDFTGKPIWGSAVFVRCPDAPRELPIRKKDGYFVFLQGEGSLHCLEAGGLYYQTRRVSVSLQPEQEPVLRIRLTPSEQYPFPEGTTFVTGETAAQTKLTLMGRSPDVRLMTECMAGDREIRLFSAGTGVLPGRTLALSQPGEPEPERICLADAVDADEGYYTLVEPLLQSYGAGATAVLSVFEVQSGTDGKIFLPLPHLNGTKWTCSVRLGETAGQYDLTVGAENRLWENGKDVD